MAKQLKKLSEVTSGIKDTNNRVIGGGIILPGIYTFAADPTVRWETSDFNGRKFTRIEVETTSGRYIDTGNLLKRTLDRDADNTLVYVNPWVGEYADAWELASGLAGAELTVTSDSVVTYSNYKGGQLLDEPVANGKAYFAEAPKKSNPKA